MGFSPPSLEISEDACTLIDLSEPEAVGEGGAFLHVNLLEPEAEPPLPPRAAMLWDISVCDSSFGFSGLHWAPGCLIPLVPNLQRRRWSRRDLPPHMGGDLQALKDPAEPALPVSPVPAACRCWSEGDLRASGGPAEPAAPIPPTPAPRW